MSRRAYKGFIALALVTSGISIAFDMGCISVADEPPQASECSRDSQCDDGNKATRDYCVNGACSHQAVSVPWGS